MTMFIKNVQLSYPSLIKRQVYKGKATNYDAIIILDKVRHKGSIKKLIAAIKELKQENGKAIKPLSADSFMESGDIEKHKDNPYYHGKVLVKGINSKKPTLVDNRAQVMDEEELQDWHYGGVTAVVEVEPYFADGPGRVCLSLNGVMFKRQTEAFGGSSVSNADDFKDFADEPDQDEAPRSSKKTSSKKKKPVSKKQEIADSDFDDEEEDHEDHEDDDEGDEDSSDVDEEDEDEDDSGDEDLDEDSDDDDGLDDDEEDEKPRTTKRASKVSSSKKGTVRRSSKSSPGAKRNLRR